MNWLVYTVVISSLLVFDLGFLNKKAGKMSFQKSLKLTIFYIAIACIFGIYIYYQLGGEKTKEYYTGFFIEKAMALDNIFVISLVFKFFEIPFKYQHRVLLWGIIGVIILRAILIAGGAFLISKFSWILYIFALILLATGVKLLYLQDKEFKVQELAIYKMMKRYLNITNEFRGASFFIKKYGKTYATPLFVALMIIETLDVIFAIDSIPAIFAITKDPYIVYTSNIFAILGLRALYFCLGGMTERFKYIKYSLALILIFIGIKILLSHTLPIPTYISLLITLLLLGGGVFISLIRL